YKESFGETRMGAYREYINVPEISLVKAPSNVDDSSLALAACVTGMIYHALRKLAKINDRSTVLITGAGGGVGSHAVEMAKAFGARVIAESTSDSKKDMLYRIGADEVVDGSTAFNEKVKSMGGADIVLEAVGIHTFERSLRSLKTGGKMIVIGNVKPDPVNLPLGLIILKGNTIRGSISSTREDVRSALDMVSSGKVKPVIYKKIPIEDVNDALESLKNHTAYGRTMIKF
ncbi:MAG: zinc-binding dehydrogenase, partial [Thermoplasmata archaeon]